MNSVLPLLSIFVAPSLVPEAGVQLAGPTVIESQDGRASLELPRGWLGVLAPGQELFWMESSKFEGRVVVMADQMSASEARQTMGAPIDLGGGVLLHPKSSPTSKGRKLSASYSVVGAVKMNEGFVQTTAHKSGVGVAFIAVGTPKSISGLKASVRKMSNSLRFSKPKAPKPGAAGAGAWAGALSGRKLTWLYTASGYTEEAYIWLCPDGRFFYSSAAGGFGGGSSGAFASKNAGRWSATGPQPTGALSLRYNDGRSSSYALRLDGSKLLLDERRWFREATSCD